MHLSLVAMARRRARRTAPPLAKPESWCSGDDADSDDCGVRRITRPSQVQLSSLSVVERELSAADDGGDLWRPGMHHDEDRDPRVGGSSSRVAFPPEEPRKGRPQATVDWARLAALLGEVEGPPLKREDRASGPDAPMEPDRRSLTAHGSAWYLLGGTALFGVGCALGFGLALNAGLGSIDCTVADDGLPQLPPDDLHLSADADSLSKCRTDLLGEQNERSRMETAMDRCDVERKNLLDQLHWLAAKMATPSG